jgi:spore coat polysaccharide biosynthesis predicted glycosyltransferase SpsG
MTSLADARVIFVAPAGPRRGFGHLVRCVSLARALGVRPLIALRGSRHAREVALMLGADVLARPTPRVLAAMRPDVVIVDDPFAARARPWASAARRAGAHVVTLHDLGLGYRNSDLVVDGSVTRAARGRRSLRGTRFAVLDPRVRAIGHQRSSGTRQALTRILVALGGGPHARLATAIASGIVAASPRVQVRIASGFVQGRRPSAGRIAWVLAPRGLAGELSRADVAVVGGGVSLYEACALGTPCVGVPVVRSQIPTVEAFARRRAVVGAPFGAAARTVAAKALALIGDRPQRTELARQARRLVDGRGAARVATAVAALAATEDHLR